MDRTRTLVNKDTQNKTQQNCKRPDDINSSSSFSKAYNKGIIFDSGSIGWSLLGIFADPIWAFIVYLCWRDFKPRCAKKALIGAAIGATIRFVFIALVTTSCTAYVNDVVQDYQDYQQSIIQYQDTNQ